MNDLVKHNSAPEAISEEDLVHRLYDAVADNSLWPEMISEVMEHLEGLVQIDGRTSEQFEGLVQHIDRARLLSENMVNLQERCSTLEGVMDSLSFGISLYDRSGQQIYANVAALETGAFAKKIEALARSASLEAIPKSQDLPALMSVSEHSTDVAIIPVSSIKKGHLPANAATLVVTLPSVPEHTLDHVKRTHYLTDAEGQLLGALHQIKDLRKAAQAINITYESARTYLKRIYAKTGVSTQSTLLALLERNPVSLIQHIDMSEPKTSPARHRFCLSDGREMEYFAIGAKSARPVLHFDALTGVALDVLGTPELYMPVLEELDLQLIVPARPGTFRSQFKKLSGLSESTPDLVQLLDTLGLDRVTLLSQAFGSSSALAFAATAPDRVARTVLCAPSYPKYEPPDWRKMDLFYIISGVIGRRAPALMKAIIPFLMRSVIQNTNKYLQRHIARSKCPSDIEVLSSPTLQKRIPQMLAERTALGTDGLVQENFLNTHGWDFDLNKVTCPVHILQGELDNVSHPEGSRALAELLPDASYHSFADKGQYLIFSEWPWILEVCAADTEPAARELVSANGSSPRSVETDSQDAH